MKKLTGLFDRLCTFELLHEAYLNARKEKRFREEISHYSMDVEARLFKIRDDLLAGQYSVGGYREFYVREPKKRLVMALGFRDRIVQWAVYLLLNDYLDKHYIYHSYGCRVGKGSTRAFKALGRWMAQVSRKPGPRWYYLKLDISKYFYRVDHNTVMEILRQYVDDDRFLALIESIVRCTHTPFGLPRGESPDSCPPERRLYDVGMPIGNLSSQMVANMYLNEIDQYAKHVLRIHYYIRYMDDIIILGNDLAELHRWKDAIETFLRDKLRLDLNRKTAIRPINHGVEFVGYRIYPTHTIMRKSTRKRIKRRLKFCARAYTAQEMDLRKVRAVSASYFGMMKHCNSYALQKWISENIVYVRHLNLGVDNRDDER